MNKKKDRLDEYIKYEMSGKGKLLLIVILFFLWLTFSHNLFVMLIFFGATIIISILLTIYELIFYHDIYKE
ncbi:hypothetical protein [Vagococcus carniphilus]|uniref:Uncharacterized protein n=1 Tax=Vagococcus carniphilus TaxID=218144 RepID=A0A430B032_9ENTE|nr:hypothetical protein [Vagococcus carniphilus]QNN73038.1 hypothetical protein H9L18_14515 [Vagococcus carniphilus]RSU13685.1 hypothetical protein CBF28_09380 [Vagococcus carniphilus]